MLVINNISKIKGTLPSGGSDSVLTRNSSTFVVGSVTNINSLANGKIFIGNVSNVPTAQTISGDITLSNAGVVAISTGVIVNSDVNASAAIALTKLAATTVSRALVSTGAGFISPATTTATEIGYVNGVTSAIQTQLNAKQATITGAASSVVTSNLSTNVVAVTDGSGKLASSSTTTTALGYISTLSSAAQTQLNTKLTTSLGALANGDIVYYNGSSWTNLPRGTNGQALFSTGATIQWNTPTINGIPTGGTANQYLAKNSGTDFDVSWTSLTLSKVTDVTATAAEVNILHGVTASTAQLNYLNTTTSDVQTQLNNKLSNSLAYNALFVGNNLGQPSALAAGTNGYVLTVSGGSPTWAANTVTTPLTTKGDLYTYSTVNTRLAAGTNQQVLSADSTQTTGLVWINAMRTAFQHHADAGTPASTTETDLYTDTLPASFFASTGDALRATYNIHVVSTGGATKRTRLYFGGTQIFDGGAATFTTAADISYDVNVVRDSGTSVICTVRQFINGSSTFSTSQVLVTVTKVTGLTLSNTQIIKITGQSGAGAAANDMVAISSVGEYLPAAI